MTGLRRKPPTPRDVARYPTSKKKITSPGKDIVFFYGGFRGQKSTFFGTFDFEVRENHFPDEQNVSDLVRSVGPLKLRLCAKFHTAIL